MNSSYIEQAISNYGNTVLRVAISVTCNRADAEDVFSDVFFALYKRGEEFDSSEHLKAWLIRSAINRSKNVRTSFWARNRRELDENAACIEPFSEVSTLMQKSDVLCAIKKLEKKERAVVFLHFYEGYNYREIATLLAINESTIRSLARRARHKLHGLLGEDF